MTLNIVDAIGDGFSRAASFPGAIFAALFTLGGLGFLVATQSLISQVYDAIDLREVYEASETGMTYEEFVQQVEGAFPLDFLDFSIEVLIGLMVLVLLVQVVVRIGAVRWFVGTNGELAVGLFLRRLLWTVGNLVLGWVILGVLLFIPFFIVGLIFLSGSAPLGLLAFFLALIVAVYLYVAFMFFNFEIIVEGANAIDGLTTSWSLTSGNRLLLFLVLLLVGIAGWILGFVSQVALPATEPPGLVAGQVLAGIVGAVTLGIYAALYNQLLGAETESVSAAGPDDL